MKTLMMLALATGALLGVQAFSATPAEAFGWCGLRGSCCKGAVFFRAPACTCRKYYRARRCCR